MDSKANVILLGESTIDNIVWVHSQKDTVKGCLEKDLKDLSIKKPEEKVNTIIDQLFEHIVDHLDSNLEYKDE